MFVNATKGQKHVFCPSKACGIMGDSEFQRLLALLLIHRGHGMADQQDQHTARMENSSVEHVASLQTLSLRFLGDHEKEYLPFDHYLPHHMIKSIDEAYLTGNSVGAWCGDEIILTGDNSVGFTPFMPPPGEEDYRNVYDYADKMYPDSHDFNNIWSAFFGEPYKGPFARLYRRETPLALVENFITKLEASSVSNKKCIVVNLDKREYLDPRHYQAGEKTILDIVKNSNCNGVMLGLMICLTYSTAAAGYLPASVRSPGAWGGDRIVICTKKEVKNFHLYKNVSN